MGRNDADGEPEGLRSDTIFKGGKESIKASVSRRDEQGSKSDSKERRKKAEGNESIRSLIV